MNFCSSLTSHLLITRGPGLPKLTRIRYLWSNRESPMLLCCNKSLTQKRYPIVRTDNIGSNLQKTSSQNLTYPAPPGSYQTDIA